MMKDTQFSHFLFGVGLFLFGLLAVLCFTIASAQQPSPQPVPIKSYDEWALHQEIGCRSTLATIWKHANKLEDDFKVIADENMKLKDELAKLKEAQRAPDAPATN